MGGSPWQLLIGQIVDGKFRLTEFLGAGSFGGVFKAENFIGDRVMRVVAVKLIAPPEGRTPEQADAIRDLQLAELQISAILDHPNIVRCYSIGEARLSGVDYLYMALELGEMSLEERFSQGAMDLDEVTELAIHLITALAYLHGYQGGMVHRDVKPGNLLYIGDGWKLADLGTARIMEGEDSAKSRAIGTADYAPPESYDGEISTAWDMWSYGVVLLEALTGKLPFSADTATALMKKVISGRPKVPKDLPEPFSRIIKGCLVKDREDRLTAPEVIKLLQGGSIDRKAESKDKKDGKPSRPARRKLTGEPEEDLRQAVREAFSDKVIDAEERRMLHELRKKLGLDLNTATTIILEERLRATNPPRPKPESKPVPAPEKKQAPVLKPAAKVPAGKPQPVKQPGPGPVSPVIKAEPKPETKQVVEKPKPQPAKKQSEPTPREPVRIAPQSTAVPADASGAITVGPFMTPGVDTTSIRQALEMAEPGGRIRIKPGLYRENIVITKPVVIEGAGGGESTIEGINSHAVLMQAPRASIRNLNLRCVSTNPQARLATVFVARGQMVLDGCHLESQSYAVALAAGPDSNLVILGGSLGGESQLGAGYIDRARGIIAGCTITGLITAGVFAGKGSSPEVRLSKVRDCGTYGIMVDSGGRCVLENTEVSGCGVSGVEIRREGSADILKCLIVNNKRLGICADTKATGKVQGCVLTGNTSGNWDLAVDSNIVRVGNRENL